MRVGVEVGGTFTDLVAVEGGKIVVTKVPSTPRSPDVGAFDALKASGIDLSTIEDLGHGSTVATNTILEKKGAKVGMLTTEGFRDSLEIRRGIRENQWDHRAPFPEVLVPRYLRLPVRGRLASDGSELAPVALEDAECRLLPS